MKHFNWAWTGAAITTLALTACGGGGGGSVETVSLDPTALCNSAGAQPKVFNGATCVSYKTTPVIFLGIANADGSFSYCSGTLITPTHVLTAAHCVSDNPKSVAAINFKSDSQYKELAAKNWVVHPAYSANGFVNDAAVVTFPAGLPNPGMAILASEPSRKGQAVYFAGWGLPGEELAVGSANLTIVNNAKVGFKFDGAQSNTCPGDSGGPMYRLLAGGPALVGITSTGSTAQCGQQDTSLFTNVQTPVVLEFIRANAPGAAIL
jgi:secreted trypsin-like serine protease